jgi:hypothetical protein
MRNFQEKDRKVFEFVRSLPAELRKLVRPPLPPAFERLNPEVNLLKIFIENKKI